MFGNTLASQLRLGRSERPPLNAEELYLERAFHSETKFLDCEPMSISARGARSLGLSSTDILTPRGMARIPSADNSTIGFAPRREPYRTMPTDLLELRGKCNDESRMLGASPHQ